MGQGGCQLHALPCAFVKSHASLSLRSWWLDEVTAHTFQGPERWRVRGSPSERKASPSWFSATRQLWCSMSLRGGCLAVCGASCLLPGVGLSSS